MKIKALILSVVTVVFAVTVGLASRAAPPPVTAITLNAAVRYQTMNGWEATAQAAQGASSSWLNYKNLLLDQAAADGINRLRVEIKNPVGSTSWDYTLTDEAMDQLYVPLKQRLQARGETLWLNVCWVPFDVSAPFINSPSAYGVAVRAAYQHFQTKYGVVPDSWEIALEPDTSRGNLYNGSTVGALIKAAGDALSGAGFTPKLIAPSATNARQLFDTGGSDYIRKIAAVPGAMAYISEFSYHRYTSPSSAENGTISSLGQQYGKQTSMLELIGADYNTLQLDLKTERNSAWQQYALAKIPAWGPDNGDAYYLANDTVNPPTVTIASRTKFLRQYFKYVRRGAVRIEATSSNPFIDPIAFINTNGGYVVVVKAVQATSFDVGLPQGTYGLKYTTAGAYDQDLPDQTGTIVNTSIPAAGVLTIYAKSGGGTPTPTPTPTPSPSPSPSPSQTPTPTPTPTPCTCPTPTPTPSPSVTPTPSPTPTPTATPTPGAVPTISSVTPKSGGGQTFVWTHNSTTSTLVVAVNMSGNAGRQVSSVIAGGVSLTQKVFAQHTGGSRAEIWGTQVAPTGSVTVTVTTTGPPASFVGAAISVANMASFGPTVSATGQSTTPSAVTASASNELVLDSLCHEDLTTDTVGSGQIELWNLAAVTDLGGAGSSEPGAVSNTMSWTLGVSKSWALVAIRLKGN